MKNVKSIMAVLVGVLFLLQSCSKKCDYVVYEYTPVYKTLEEVREGVSMGNPLEIANPGKILVFQNYLFVNDQYRGVHIIDNADPKNPNKVGFVPVLGSKDIALKGTSLYVDSYMDLLEIDISNPSSPIERNRLENQFVLTTGMDANMSEDLLRPGMILVGWEAKRTVKSGKCLDNGEGFENPLPSEIRGLPVFDVDQGGAGTLFGKSAIMNAVAGSESRFAIVDDYLYVVEPGDIKTYSINGDLMFKTSTSNNGFTNFETVYPEANKLFIGSSNAMLIYSLSNPESPTHESSISHVTSCDPVVAEENYAFVTIRTGTICDGLINRLEIVDLNTYSYPFVVKQLNLINPHGVGVDGNYIFVCDGADGLKVFEGDPADNFAGLDNVPIAAFPENFAYDVIVLSNQKLIILSSPDGIIQYFYNDITQMEYASILN